MATDYIPREEAIEALVNLTAYNSSADIKLRVESKYYYQHEWIGGIKDALEEIENIPAVDTVPVVRCGECKHRPTIPDDYTPTADGSVLDFPDEKCPCQVGDYWYSKYLGDDWFCAYGERKEEDEK